MHNKSSWRPNGAINKLHLLYKLLLLALIAVGVGYPQSLTTGDITGVVKDSSGGVVPNAKVDLQNENTGEIRSVETNNTGQYRITTLPPAPYKISASVSGLKSGTDSVVVSIGQVVTFNITVTPQGTTQEVVVNDAVPLLQSDNANQSTTLSAKQIQELPLPGGDTTTVAFTSPGITVNVTGGYGNFTSHGLPSTSNLFTTNGNDNNDPYLNVNNSGASNLTLGANEIAEAAVVQNAYTASYGRQAGAQVNIVTKSGTNEFHGNASWDWNGDYLNANDFFANSTATPRGRADSNQYAASFGGPVKKNKLFFFVDTEGIRYILPTSSTVSIPSAALESYVERTVSPAQLPLYQNAFNLYNNAPGANRAANVVGSSTSSNLDDSTGNMGCGALAGTPTGTGGTFGVDTSCARAYQTNVTGQNTEWLMTARADWNINDQHKVFFRFKTDHGTQPTHIDPINPAFSAQSVQPSYEGQVDYTYVITPTMVNHFIGSGSYSSAIFGPANFQQSLSTFPTYFQFADGGANGSGQITNLGINTRSYLQGRNVGQLAIVDDFSLIKGNHNIKIGVNLRKNRVSDYGPQTLTQGGAWEFANLADFASGQLINGNGDYFEQRYSNFDVAHLSLYNVGFYIQDEWAVRSNLKVTLGIRFDRTGNPGCADKCFTRLNAPFSDLPHGANIPYNQSITGGYSTLYPSIEPLAYQPRLGIVWSPTNKTVIRTGFGIFSDQPEGTIASNVFNNSPNIFTPVLRAGTVGTSAVPGSMPIVAAQTNAAFRQGFAAGDTLAQISNALPAGVAFTPPGYFSVPNELYSPKYLEWSFEVQQELSSKDAITLSYSGTHGYEGLIEDSGLNTYNQFNRPGYSFLPSSAADPRFRIITSLGQDGISNYNGLSVQYRRAFAYGFQGQVNYTWSHALDDVSSFPSTPYFTNVSATTLLYPFNKSLNYANSDFDIRHSLTGDFTWDLPFKTQNHFLNAIISGWTTSAKAYARTGTPFSVYESSQAAKISSSTGGNVLAYFQGGAVPGACTNVNVPCLSASQFTVNGFGNLGRNAFRGPGYFDIDYGAFKSFQVKERLHFQVGANFYNLLNHANFNTPGYNANLAGLGTITSTAEAPTSAYGATAGAGVSGRVIVTTARLTF